MKRTTLFGILVALSLTALVGAGAIPHAAAQGTNDTTAHPIVGMWWWDNGSADPFDDSFAVFQSDGTYIEETPFIGAGIGTWVPTEERTAELLIVFQDTEGGVDPNEPAAFVAGTLTFRLSIEVDAAGDSLVAKGLIETRSPDGALLDESNWEGTARHVGTDWAMPASTPEAHAVETAYTNFCDSTDISWAPEGTLPFTLACTSSRADAVARDLRADAAQLVRAKPKIPGADLTRTYELLATMPVKFTV